MPSDTPAGKVGKCALHCIDWLLLKPHLGPSGCSQKKQATCGHSPK